MKRKFSKILCGLVLMGSSAFAQAPTDGLVGYWPFNGNANDESGNGNNGTVYGASLATDRFGNNNSAYRFNGIDNWIFISNSSLVSNNSLAISVWFKAKSKSTNGVLIASGNQNDYVLHYMNDSLLFGIHTDSNNLNGGFYTDSTSEMNSTKWQSVILNYNGNKLDIYIDGNLTKSIIASGNIYSWQQDALAMGVYTGDGNPLSDFFEGELDDIRLYNRSLDSTEIKALYSEYSYSINSSTSNLNIGRIAEVAISTDTLKSESSIISYQFDIAYDNSKLQYLSAAVDGTIASSGSITVNTTDEGKLNISYMSSTAISGVGDILKLNFKTIGVGSTTPVISNFLFNADTVYNVTNGAITINSKYGDIDVNNYVQAYDAALALQYSVGIDALSIIDPLPWEDWRINVANVDSEGSVTANDAALILQYSAKRINIFPAEVQSKITRGNSADVVITQEGNQLVFRSQGNLIGLNVFVKDNISELGQPNIIDNNMITALNITADNYAIGLATSTAPTEGSVFMTIPLKSVQPNTFSFDMIINAENTTRSISTESSTTAINETQSTVFGIYPNPINEILKISRPSGYDNALVSIFNNEGKLIYSGQLKSGKASIDVASMHSGIYNILISNGSETLSKKFIKQ